MSYTVLAHVSTGELATAALHNTLLDNLDGVYAGGVAIASQAALDFVYGSSATQLARLAAGAALTSPRINADGNGWEFAAASIALVGVVEGTNTTAAATNVATVAISGLTVKDQLLVMVTHSSATQGTAEPVLYNSTDSVVLAEYLNSINSVTTGVYSKWAGLLGVDQSSNTKVVTWGIGTPGVTTGYMVTGSINGQVATATTAWTGAWNLSLRTGTGGVTAGGTYRYRLSVYKIAGQ